MVAFSASSLVCAAIEVISATTSPIFCAPSESARTMPSVRRASATALPVICEDSVTRRLISPIEDANSSAAAATVCTPALAAPAASVTAAAQ
jgi:hypothetical protein